TMLSVNRPFGVTSARAGAASTQPSPSASSTVLSRRTECLLDAGPRADNQSLSADECRRIGPRRQGAVTRRLRHRALCECVWRSGAVLSPLQGACRAAV